MFNDCVFDLCEFLNLNASNFNFNMIFVTVDAGVGFVFVLVSWGGSTCCMFCS